MTQSSTIFTRRSFLETSAVTAAASFLGSSFAVKGESPESLQVSTPERHQYKKQNRDRVAEIADGELDKPIAHFRDYLEQYPTDLEAFFGLALAHTRRGELPTALDYVQRAVDHGIPFERFLAGPRELFRPLTETDGFQEMARRYPNVLVHGPLLGAITETSAKFWVRTHHPVSVQVYASRPGGRFLRSSTVAQTSAATDYTAVVEMEDLAPATDYSYRLRLEGQELPGRWGFTTLPAEGRSARFSVGFGGCAGYTPWNERIWRTIASHQFPAFFLTGDNVYIDHPEYPEVQQYCYYRRQSRPEFRALSASTSIFAIWDDHDFADNDSWGGSAVEDPTWKRSVWETFRTNWNNPAYGGGEEQPGCWFDVSMADVDFFMLDDRYYRTDPSQEAPTMLGPVQKRWLFEKLKASTATFKFLVTSVPWADGTKPGSLDPWQGYKEERAEIFSFLHKHRIEGVMLLAGDRHRSDLWKIERAEGYDLYEFESGRLTNYHTHEKMSGALFSYNEKCSFGRLAFDTTRTDPRVTYEIISIDNEVVFSHTVRKSEISY